MYMKTSKADNKKVKDIIRKAKGLTNDQDHDAPLNLLTFAEIERAIIGLEELEKKG